MTKPPTAAGPRPFRGRPLSSLSTGELQVARQAWRDQTPPMIADTDAEFRALYMCEPERGEDPGPAVALLRREILAGRLSLSMVTSALVEAEREVRRRPPRRRFPEGQS